MKGGEFKVKRTIAIILALGLLLASGGVVLAAPTTMTITAAVSNAFTMAFSDSEDEPLTSLAFAGVQPGVPTPTPQTLTVKTTGSGGSYQLTLASTNFTTSTTPVLTQAASVLQFQEKDATTWKNASTTAQNMLTTAGTSTPTGDIKDFDLRMNFPASASDGNYSGTITITCVPQ